MKKKELKISIVAGGLNGKQFLPDIAQGDMVIGVDRGALWLIQKGITPHVALGDFDSVSGRELSRIRKRVGKVRLYPKKKDATDLELAVDEAIRYKPSEVRIYGALGDRFDHSLAAISLLLKLSSHNICGYIVDKFNRIQIVRRELILQPSQIFHYVSLFPVGGKVTVTLRGFAYNLRRHVIIRDSTLTISNEIIGRSATINVHRGKLLVILSRD